MKDGRRAAFSLYPCCFGRAPCGRPGERAYSSSQAVAENKKGDTIKLVCFDADDKLIGYLKDGTIADLLLQDPYRMG